MRTSRLGQARNSAQPGCSQNEHRKGDRMHELNALRNMPIWIDRCHARLVRIRRVEGETDDYKQLMVFRDYMRAVTQ
jgi:hypothetical protein